MRFLRRTAEKLTGIYGRVCAVATAAYFLWAVMSLLRWTDPAYAKTAGVLMTGLRFCFAVPLAGVIACGWVLNPKRAAYQIPVLTVLLLSHRIFRTNWLIDVFLFAFASRYTDGWKMLKAACSSWAIVLIAAAVLLLTGLTGDRTVRFAYGEGHSFGMLHPNSLGAVLLSSIMTVWCVFLRRRPAAAFVLSWAGAAAAWFVCASRTSALLLAALPLLDLGVKAIRKSGRAGVLKAAVFLPAALTALSLCLTVCALNKVIPTAGSFMARFRYAAKALRIYGVGLLGSPVKLGAKMILDNQYMYWLICQGILPALFAVGLETYMIRRFVTGKNDGALIVCVACLGLGFMENISLWPVVNAMPLILLCDRGTLLPRPGKVSAGTGENGGGIAFLVGGTTISGGNRVILDAANALERRGERVALLCTGEITDTDWYPDQRVEILPVAEGADRQWDTAVTTFWETNEYLPALRAKRRVYLVQSDERRFYGPLSPNRLRAEDTYRRRDTEYLCVAGWMKEWLKRSFGTDATVIENGIDAELYASAEPEEKRDGRVRILIEGDPASRVKGVREAMAIARGTGAEIWCVNPGGDNRGLEGAARIFNRVPTDRMPGIYRSCDILLKTSRFESFCLPALEMMAAGGVVEAARTRGVEEFIEDGVNGFLFDQGDREGAARILKELTEDAGKRAEVGKAAAETAARFRRTDAVEGICAYLTRTG